MSHKENKTVILDELQTADDDHPVEELEEDRELTEQEEARMREKLNKQIARSLEFKIKDLTDISLGRFPAKIKDIQFEEDQLMIRIGLPFLLPPASPEAGKLSRTRREKERIRTQFAKHLKKKENEKQLSNFFSTRLVDFLIGICTSKKFSPEIVKNLRNISQRNLAGRPTQGISRKASRYIRDEGQSIKNTILTIQSQVRAMKKCNKDLANDAVLEMLRREYPSGTYPWMPEFLAMDRLPRRRYLEGGITDQDSPNSANPGWKLRSCGLSEPDKWWTLEITVRVIQAKLHTETEICYPLREIRPLLKSK